MAEPRRHRARWVLLAALPVAVGSCAPLAPPIAAVGEIAGERIVTTVDSEAARYYLERTLRGERRDSELDAAFDRLHEAQAAVPTREELQLLAQRYSTDFAALHLARRLSEIEINRRAQAVFRQQLTQVRQALAAGLSPGQPRFADYLVLFVPGWDYKRSSALTGADFAVQRALLQGAGLENRLLDVPSNGSIESIADAIAQELARVDSGKELILASASSAGPAVALALGEVMSPTQNCRVRAWLNIGGLLQGTPLADPYRRWPMSWVAGIVGFFLDWDAQAVESMTVERSRPRHARLRLPSHVFTINYVGIPLSGTVSELARERYLSLRREGPNDGLTPITDALVPNSPTIVSLGQDHFLAQDPEIGPKTLALARTLMVLLDTRSAPQACSIR